MSVCVFIKWSRFYSLLAILHVSAAVALGDTTAEVDGVSIDHEEIAVGWAVSAQGDFSASVDPLGGGPWEFRSKLTVSTGGSVYSAVGWSQFTLQPGQSSTWAMNADPETLSSGEHTSTAIVELRIEPTPLLTLPWGFGGWEEDTTNIEDLGEGGECE